MAYIWHLAAGFDDEASARAFYCFDIDRIQTTSGKIVTSMGGAEYVDTGWEFYIVPQVGAEHLNGHGGPADETEAKDLLDVGTVYYEWLKTAPPFRHAICGVEVGEWLSREDFIARAREGEFERHADSYHGLVVSESFWEELGRPVAFVPFADGRRWIPWKGPDAP